jgi:hypothetical protein
MVTLVVLLMSTTLHVYSPWAGSIPARGVTIERTVRGSCSRGSDVLKRSDAWHCGTLDPCFSNDRVGVGAHVICMTSPWEDATLVELTRALPEGRANHDGGTTGRPWAIVTAAGERCELAPSGLSATYVCAGSALLFGLPTRGRTWTQLHAASSTAKHRRVALRLIWY